MHLGAGGHLADVATGSQHFAVCNTSSLLSLLVMSVFQLMTTGSLSCLLTRYGNLDLECSHGNNELLYVNRVPADGPGE